MVYVVTLTRRRIERMIDVISNVGSKTPAKQIKIKRAIEARLTNNSHCSKNKELQKNDGCLTPTSAYLKKIE